MVVPVKFDSPSTYNTEAPQPVQSEIVNSVARKILVSTQLTEDEKRVCTEFLYTRDPMLFKPTLLNIDILGERLITISCCLDKLSGLISTFANTEIALIKHLTSEVQELSNVVLREQEIIFAKKQDLISKIQNFSTVEIEEELDHLQKILDELTTQNIVSSEVKADLEKLLMKQRILYSKKVHFSSATSLDHLQTVLELFSANFEKLKLFREIKKLTTEKKVFTDVGQKRKSETDTPSSQRLRES